MVAIGLVAVLSYFGGYWLTNGESRKKSKDESDAPLFPLTLIALAYCGAIVISFTIQRIAWSYPQLTQLLFVLSYVRYVFLFVLITRLMRPKPQWGLITLVVVV